MYNEEKVLTILEEVFGLSGDQITDDIAYNSFQAWDSLKHLQMVAMMEEEFGIELEMDDIIDMSTVGKIKEILKKYFSK
jgi:acyl carrier protein